MLTLAVIVFDNSIFSLSALTDKLLLKREPEEECNIVYRVIQWCPEVTSVVCVLFLHLDGAGCVSADTLTHWTSACKCVEGLCNKSRTEEHSHTTGGYFSEIMCLYQSECVCGGENVGTYRFQRSQSQIGEPEGDLQALITTHTLSIRDCEVWQHPVYIHNTAWPQVSWFF